MYFLSVLLLTVLLPIASVALEYFLGHSSLSVMLLVGKWFVFWAAGVRLLLAGLRQFFQPRFTAEGIFRMSEVQAAAALPVVRELGMANFATGVVGIASLIRPRWVLPVAIIAAIFYGAAGICHAVKGSATRNETIAMVSDLFVFAVLLVYLGFTIFR